MVQTLEDPTTLYKLIADNSRDLICLHDPDGHYRYLNPMVETLLGFKAEELIGTDPYELFHPEDQPRILHESHAMALSGREDMLVEYRIRTHSGTYIWVETATRIVRENDQIIALVTSSRDITQRKQQEAALRMSELRLRAVINNAPFPAMIHAEDGEVLLINDAWTELSGYTLKDIPTITTWTALAYGERQHDVKATIDRLYTSRERLIREGEFEITAKDGARRIWVFHSSPVSFLQDGRRTMLSMANDITERKNAERALQYSQQFAQATLDALSAHVAILDTRGEIVAVNRAWRDFARSHGVDDLSAVGVGVNYLHVCDKAEGNDSEGAHRFAAGIRAVIRGATAEYIQEYSFHTPAPDGTSLRRWFVGRVTRFVGAETTYIVLSHEDITQQKRSESALAHEHDLLRTLIDNIPDYIFIKDREGRFTASNQAHARAAGMSPYELRGKTALEVFPVEFAAEFHADDLQVLQNQQALINAERRTVDEKGQDRWVLTTKIPLLDDRGEAKALVGISRDITDKKQAERDVASANERLRILNRILALTSATLDLNDVLQMICDEMARILQAPLVSALLIEDDGLNALVLTETRREDVPSRVGLALPVQDDPIFDYLQRYKVPLVIEDSDLDDRSQRVMAHLNVAKHMQSAMIVPLFVRGEMVGAVIFGSDTRRTFTEDEITLAASVAQSASQAVENSLLYRAVSQTNAQLTEIVDQRTAELRKLNARMGVILNNTDDAIVLVNADGEIEITNPAFDRLLGYAQGELWHQPLQCIVTPENEQHLLEGLRQGFEAGLHRFETQARRKTGDTFDADIACVRVDASGQNAVISVHDISRFKEVERMKDQFISIVNHELRTPITGITLSAGNLARYYDRMPDERRLQKVGQIRAQADVLIELIDSILDLSRFEQNAAAMGPIDMGMIVRTIVSQLQPSAQAKQQTLNLSIVPNVAYTLVGERDHLSHLWRNLVSNAIKYTPEGGDLRVNMTRIAHQHTQIPTLPDSFDMRVCATLATLETGDYLLGQVCDNGHGMRDDDLKMLFSRFHRGWAKQSTIPGTGLGLAMVKEILTAYHGDIHVASELKVGSVFTFWLPIMPDDNSS